MSPRWGLRVTVAVVLGTGAGVLLWWLQTSLRYAVFAGVWLGLATCWWLVRDLGPAAHRATWTTSEAPQVAHEHALDHRVRWLRHAVADGAGPEGADRLHGVLRELSDERLRRHHGAGLDAPAEALRPVLGPDLDDYLRAPVAPSLSPARLSLLLDRIESL
ncbi:MAG TPA: hypothetical protein VFJ12_03515 [Segeticoccus sp.]|nr:hypothetical protein [Segeticoccus sp.]